MPTTEHRTRREPALPGIHREVDGQPSRNSWPSLGTQKAGGVSPETLPAFDRLADATSHIQTYRAAIRYGIG